MATICPTVMAKDAHDYREQMERVQGFASRVHIDVVDGFFAPNKTVNPSQLWWPEGAQADIHMMHRRPLEHLSTLIKLNPHLAIIHAEAEVDHVMFAASLRKVGIRAGLAILQDTSVENIHHILKHFDHVLIFGGHLSYHAKEADLDVLKKIGQVRELHPHVEIGWDGGVNDHNAKQIVGSGVDVLNVGGFIQEAYEPSDAYSKLQQSCKA